MRGSLEQRPSYMGQKVIDMSKIRMDFFRNEITGSTLKCLDPEFINSLSTRPEKKQEEKSKEPGELFCARNSVQSKHKLEDQP